VTLGLAWWPTGVVDDWLGLNPCRDDDRAFLASKGVQMSVYRPALDAVTVLRGSRAAQDTLLPMPSVAVADPPLLLTLVAFQRRGDRLVRSPARVVRAFHGCVLQPPTPYPLPATCTARQRGAASRQRVVSLSTPSPHPAARPLTRAFPMRESRGMCIA
jgi:hypothetical protein